MTLNTLKKELAKLGIIYSRGKKTVSRHELKITTHYEVSYKIENDYRSYSVMKKGNITADDMRKLFMEQLKDEIQQLTQELNASWYHFLGSKHGN